MSAPPRPPHRQAGVCSGSLVATETVTQRGVQLGSVLCHVIALVDVERAFRKRCQCSESSLSWGSLSLDGGFSGMPRVS